MIEISPITRINGHKLVKIGQRWVFPDGCEINIYDCGCIKFVSNGRSNMIGFCSQFPVLCCCPQPLLFFFFI